ncbi:MAG: hypothetical protein ABWY38_07310 [Methyloceanibacter sp.]
MTYLGESTDAIGNSVDVTWLSVGAELKRHFDTKSGASVEPFAFFKSSSISATPPSPNRLRGTRWAPACR